MSTQPPAPYQPQASPGQGRSPGGILAIIIASAVGLVMLTLAGLILAGYFFASRVHVQDQRDRHGKERSLQIETPVGGVHVDVDSDAAIDAKLLGIPIYPGASKVENAAGAANIDLDLSFVEKSLQAVAVEMESPDPLDKVISFYRQQAPDYLYSQKDDGAAQFIWKEGGLRKIIAVRRRGSKVRISLARVGEPEPN